MVDQAEELLSDSWRRKAEELDLLLKKVTVMVAALGRAIGDLTAHLTDEQAATEVLHLTSLIAMVLSPENTQKAAAAMVQAQGGNQRTKAILDKTHRTADIIRQASYEDFLTGRMPLP
jgi:hypothetical protein